MTPEELQTAFDELTDKHADLQARYDQMAPMLLDLQGHLKTVEAARDTYKNGFDMQTKSHSRAIEIIKRLKAGLPVDTTTDGPAPAA